MGMVAGMKDTFIDPGCEDDDDLDEGFEDAVEKEDDVAIELIDEIIQVFDDFLWENNAKLDNKEAPEDDWAEQNIIYGQQRDDLACRIFEKLQEWGVI